MTPSPGKCTAGLDGEIQEPSAQGADGATTDPRDQRFREGGTAEAHALVGVPCALKGPCASLGAGCEGQRGSSPAPTTRSGVSSHSIKHGVLLSASIPASYGPQFPCAESWVALGTEAASLTDPPARHVTMTMTAGEPVSGFISWTPGGSGEGSGGGSGGGSSGSPTQRGAKPFSSSRSVKAGGLQMCLSFPLPPGE